MVAPALLRGESQRRVAADHPEVRRIQRKLLAADDASCNLGIPIVDEVAKRKHAAGLGDQAAA